MLNNHMDNKNERSVLYYRKALGYHTVNKCTFHHVVGSEDPICFVRKLCEVIASKIKKILGI